jgi:mono/diheme cytochrome c family protein
MIRVLVLLLSVCGFAVAQKESAKLPAVPPQAAAKKNPLAGDAEAAKGGRKLFNRQCAQCHGDDGKSGKRGAIDLTSPEIQRQSDGALFWMITNGNSRRGMPAWSHMPEMERWQVVLHLRQLATGTQ